MRTGLYTALIVLLSACSSVVGTWDPTDYTVTSGETVYSIAWKYELDPFELARWNGLSRPYRVYTGQRLKMQPPEGSGAATASRPTPGTRAAGKVIVDRGDTLYSIAREHGTSASRLAAINGLQAPYLIKPGQTILLKKPATRPAVSTAKADAKPVPTGSASVQRADRNIRWRWPVTGKLLNTFSTDDPDRKGIDIAGTEGTTVRATAPGRVVYSGDGLISYGNLVIIKHSRNYLSAYAHNRKLMVEEGDVVESGQVIAEMGQTGTDSPRLHFEIRKNGKPVDPLSYLPRS